ncbi:hypothetical protein FQR65_LT08563 [Abscondita terminalis]|nr:hypothetical protein FQR65_LT08563 [Abscondita terminalis]
MSDLDTNESEHELSYYAKDKVKLMKEVLKIIKPKKIKAMAPDCIKHMDIVEINSMLLEELLGISNKRLQYIFKGENADRETSSSESEDEEKEKIDVISLDDISDDEDFDVCVAGTSQTDIAKGRKKKLGKHHNKTINKIQIKKEKKPRKLNARKETQVKKETEEDKLMNVLELLELQARARAIRSQLAIENENKTTVVENSKVIKNENESDSDAVIIDSPQHNEIVITSESEGECNEEKRDELSAKKLKLQPSREQPTISNMSEAELNLRKTKLLSKLQKIKLVRNKPVATINTDNITPEGNVQEPNPIDDVNKVDNKNESVIISAKSEEVSAVNEPISTSLSFCDNDEIVINLDEDEMDDME